MKPGRNDPCSCGSGKKYKHCCEVKTGPMSRYKSLVLVAAVLVIAGGVWIGEAFFSGDAGQGSFSQQPGSAPVGKVWSTEHGHWHDAPPGQALADSGQASVPKPPGPAPAVAGASDPLAATRELARHYPARRAKRSEQVGVCAAEPRTP